MNGEQAEQEQLATDYLQDVEQDRQMTSGARCGLDGCDCEYTIGGLLRRLEIIAQEALTTVRWARGCAEPCQCGHTQAMACDTSCPCYVTGNEAERRPLGA